MTTGMDASMFSGAYLLNGKGISSGSRNLAGDRFVIRANGSSGTG
ncbi:hypothetical protein BSTAB16_6986 [Burkholderia stabilis]|uniref:Uncharacterized protein n=1 Tax=Burkholderia stabilis TaxID=95485 RepID=A0AAJ5NE55_9BURK|nr:hypothetical protein BSTAB16_6986 [Burkholderia stabilis]